MKKLKKFGGILLCVAGIVAGSVWTYNGVGPIMGPLVLILNIFLLYMVATDKIEP
tara:strand:+ start:645 stop:809 length:165 start_codon:yes stop_codon:yes gene_type:complete